MKVKLLDLIDFEKVDILLEGFNKSTGFVTAVLDLDGKVLSKSGWRRLCTEFHRKNPETSRRCTVSDTVLAGKLAAGEKYHFYKCLNGLIDVAVPIMIKGEHVANLFSGQFFFEEPDRGFFKKQAVEYGFNYDAYLESLGEVPVVSEEKVRAAMDFLQNMTQFISEMTLQRLEQMQLNETIRKSEERFTTFMDETPVYAYIKDSSLNHVYRNKKVSDLIRTDKPGEVADSARTIFEPAVAELLENADKKILTGGESRVELEYKVTLEGQAKWLDDIKFALELPDGNKAVGGLAFDITERKQAEAQLRELQLDLERRIVERTAQLEAANKELEAFSYSVSHDLRAPLRAIDGFTSMLLEGYSSLLDAEGKRLCGVISGSARDMGRLIDDLLAFSRVGRTAMHVSDVDMAAMARAICYEVTSPGERERIEFRIAQLPPAQADPSLLRQVWTNLLSNAVKFTSKKEKALIEIGAEELPGGTVYSVKDNGAGFEMQYKNKLFGVFQRLHSTKEFEGTGVGLAIVQRIVVRHGGKVWAEGETGKGASFSFTLGKGD